MSRSHKGRIGKTAQCETCPESKADGDVRGWAVRHVDKHARDDRPHTVYMLTERGTYFTPERP